VSPPETPTFYIWFVPAKVSSISPKAMLMYLLRDPVERSYSGYWHNVRMLERREEVTKQPALMAR